MVDGSEHIKFLVLALLDHNVSVPLSCTSKMNTQCIVIKTPDLLDVDTAPEPVTKAFGLNFKMGIQLLRISICTLPNPHQLRCLVKAIYKCSNTPGFSLSRFQNHIIKAPGKESPSSAYNNPPHLHNNTIFPILPLSPRPFIHIIHATPMQHGSRPARLVLWLVRWALKPLRSAFVAEVCGAFVVGYSSVGRVGGG